ncbi:ATP-dependent RNA helicase HrpA [Aquabacterium sp. A08]|uniref:ATP-dependent RNA helicase HrpA n=1 Tax=Aquabacterium sp. A08 TaxID=2718532 RepID=UPI001420D1C6|nr:ATP-dependent RNA helicase HrpA [Aquabacterium sp. A08]NIC41770.1 ATP-dependent RNA helicase HrpA [Aquabacterium sp. A08]NIC41799.1 ATP-dependent RNA helicase HrpA [Aquabacterium sp. A08]
MTATALKIEFPESLPVSGKRHEIEAALRAHQVVIVCGETGSGKTTQLPKIALAMGRGGQAQRQALAAGAAAGAAAAQAEGEARGARGGRSGGRPARPQLIGHTQPRRIAASSVATRIAEELQTPLGEVVGYKVRFNDRLGKNASVKLMTDGILLAETQTDPLLQAYDTLIIDEAHERSLNIDFLLGYIKQILPRRPDLKVIVTSATIDADRFARHFASRHGPAQVILVSGRTFPVEQRYRPFEESREHDLNDAIADAVDELWRGGAQAGDILVFLPGEREIREAADHLRKHLAHVPALRSAEVLPLFARLSAAEQDQIFKPHGQRRIVIATNVAETSLTVPGIRYVIDAGTARVKRYSLRSKVEQLLVEPISQAAANQRAGRCGRVADGICIRLYDEADFNARPRFTDPEILRSSLAAVILRMKSLHLGQVEDFPFLEAPSRRAITDGYQLLQELGAVDEFNALTPLGAELAKLPLDPRVGRMILEARNRHALDEVLVIASALSVQDVRERPMEAQAQADQAHAKFDDEKSEFTSYLKLWHWLETARGGKPAAPQAAAAPAPSHGPIGFAELKALRRQAPTSGGPAVPTAGATHKLSHRQYEALLRQNFISVRRVREWRDIHSQLHTVVAEHGWQLNTAPASYEQLHLSMLSGLLGNLGCKHDTEDVYLGARGIKFHRHPGAHLSKRPGRWIVCAELVETARLFGRGIAAIEPQWLEQVGAHLLKKQMLDPHWEKKAAEVVGYERATLYGLVVYQQRRVHYGRVDPVGARDIFIREALVAGLYEDTWPAEALARLPFLAANRKLIRQVQELEHKSRRQDVLVDDALIHAFYDSQLPPEVCSGRELERWYRDAARQQPKLLQLTREELMRHEAAGVTGNAFPKTVKLGGVDCSASYLHEPGDPKDGLTVAVPLFVLNQVSEERCEWLVPGMLKDKVQALLKSLPQKPRARLVPLPDSAEQIAAALTGPERWGQGSLTDALLKEVRQMAGLDVQRSDFKLDMLQPHQFMNLRVVDEHGRQLGQSRNLPALKAEWGAKARGAFQALAQLKLAGQTEAPRHAAAPEAAASAGGDTSAPGRAGAAPAVRSTAAGAAAAQPAPGSGPAAADGTLRHTAWTFGDWPEIMEIRQGGQTLIGFPALIDLGDAVAIQVFDEPDVAARKHRSGLRRLFALQLKDALKYLEKNIPDLQKMAVAYMALGTQEELREQIIGVAMERAFLAEPLPAHEADFKRRLDEGRGRLTLIAQEVARLCGTVLQEHAAAARKLKDTRQAPDAVADASQQLQRLVGKRFLAETPWSALQHLPRYLKAIVLRLDKHRSDPARDTTRMAEVKAQEQRYWRLLAERKGVRNERMDEFRWLLEEFRVSLFAQELRTPQPVSAKRLDKVWAQIAQ